MAQGESASELTSLPQLHSLRRPSSGCRSSSSSEEKLLFCRKRLWRRVGRDGVGRYGGGIDGLVPDL